MTEDAKRAADAEAFAEAALRSPPPQPGPAAGPAPPPGPAPLTDEEKTRAREFLKVAFNLIALGTSTPQFALTDDYCEAMGVDRPAAECARKYIGALGPEKELALCLAPHVLAAAYVYMEHLKTQREEVLTYLRGRFGRQPAGAGGASDQGHDAARPGGKRPDFRPEGERENLARAVIVGAPLRPGADS